MTLRAMLAAMTAMVFVNILNIGDDPEPIPTITDEPDPIGTIRPK